MNSLGFVLEQVRNPGLADELDQRGIGKLKKCLRIGISIGCGITLRWYFSVKRMLGNGGNKTSTCTHHNHRHVWRLGGIDQLKTCGL